MELQEHVDRQLHDTGKTVHEQSEKLNKEIKAILQKAKKTS